MIQEILLPIVTLYPGWSLFLLFLLLYALISAVPASFQALQAPRCKCKCNKVQKTDDES